MSKLSIKLNILIVLPTLICSCDNSTYQSSYDWYIEYLKLPKIWNSRTGMGITVAIIDSGIDYELISDDFEKRRVLSTYNAIDDTCNVYDETKHGTSLINLIGVDSPITNGISKDCDFLIIKALNEYGTTTDEILYKAIQYAVSYKVDIINLSLGKENKSDLVTRVIQEAYKNNIMIFASVGDENVQRVSFPAVLDECIGVGSLDYKGELYEYSNYGNGLDVVFPGVDISIPRKNIYGELISYKVSGSSVATAIASGMAALYLQNDKVIRVEDVYKAFKNSKGCVDELFKEEIEK